MSRNDAYKELVRMDKNFTISKTSRNNIIDYFYGEDGYDIVKAFISGLGNGEMKEITQDLDRLDSYSRNKNVEDVVKNRMKKAEELEARNQKLIEKSIEEEIMTTENKKIEFMNRGFTTEAVSREDIVSCIVRIGGKKRKEIEEEVEKLSDDDMMFIAQECEQGQDTDYFFDGLTEIIRSYTKISGDKLFNRE